MIGKGNISAEIIADSISKDGIRLTTLQLRYPRFIHSEFMTHRMFSRNASSSRAIPVSKMLDQVRTEPAMPIHWGLNKPGMQADSEGDVLVGKDLWEDAAFDAANIAEQMQKAGFHKQVTNRLLEPFQFISVVVTSTEWDNFFALRIHKDAQPEIQELAKLMKRVMDVSVPDKLTYGTWHTPYVNKYEILDQEQAIKCSIARCARVSYLNHDNSLPNVDDDLDLYSMLGVRPYYSVKRDIQFTENDPVHMSPFEHIATPMEANTVEEAINKGLEPYDISGLTHADTNEQLWSGNFRGWAQYRQLL